MPLALEPNERFEVVLDCDKDKPADQRPTFVYRYLAGREWREIARRQDDLDKAKSSEEAVDLTFASARTCLVDWRNMIDPATGEAISFDPVELDRIVTVIEAQELVNRIMRQGMTLADKKKSESPSPTGSEASAKDAEGPTDAGTSPAN